MSEKQCTSCGRGRESPKKKFTFPAQEKQPKYNFWAVPFEYWVKMLLRTTVAPSFCNTVVAEDNLKGTGRRRYRKVHNRESYWGQNDTMYLNIDRIMNNWFLR